MIYVCWSLMQTSSTSCCLRCRIFKAIWIYIGLNPNSNETAVTRKPRQTRHVLSVLNLLVCTPLRWSMVPWLSLSRCTPSPLDSILGDSDTNDENMVDHFDLNFMLVYITSCRLGCMLAWPGDEARFLQPFCAYSPCVGVETISTGHQSKSSQRQIYLAPRDNYGC